VIVALLERVTRLLLCVMVFLMMTVTSIDVFARYVLNAPLRGAFEIVTLVLATSTFIALPLVTRSNEHISVDLLKPLLRGTGLKIQRIAILAVAATILSVTTVQMWRHARLLADGGQVTGFLEWPLAPLGYLMSGLCGLSVLIYLAMLWEQLRGLRLAQRPPGEIDPKVL